MTIGRQRRFIRAVNADEVFQFAAPYLGIQLLCITQLAFGQRRIGRDLQKMNNPAASCGVSTPTTTAKVCAPRGGE
jgi:hypothetical protein